MKNFKRILALTLAIILTVSFVGCGKKDQIEEDDTTTTTSIEREVKTKIATTKSPLGMGLYKLSLDRGYGYEVKYCQNDSEVYTMFQNKQADMATVSLDKAAKLYNESDGNIKIIAISNLLYYHIVTTDDSIKSISDLKGKTVYSVCEGEAIESMLNYLLKEKNVEDVTLEYTENYDSLIALAKEGKADTLLMPDPYFIRALNEIEPLKENFSLFDEWNYANEFLPAYACVVAHKDYVENNPQIITEFMTFFEVATNFIIEYTVPSLLSHAGFYDSEEDATVGVNVCNITYIELEKMQKLANSMYEVLYEQNPDSLGGKIPADAIYYLG